MGKQSNEAESSLVHSVCVVAKHVLFIYKSNKIKKYMANNLKNLFPNPFPFLHIHKKKKDFVFNSRSSNYTDQCFLVVKTTEFVFNFI